jgi:hypothetical protein
MLACEPVSSHVRHDKHDFAITPYCDYRISSTLFSFAFPACNTNN